jgi:hypothetical protein
MHHLGALRYRTPLGIRLANHRPQIRGMGSVAIDPKLHRPLTLIPDTPHRHIASHDNTGMKQ